MENNWLSIKHIEQQEIATQKEMASFFGKGRNGFCDFTLDGIDLMIKGLYMRDNDIFIDKDKIKYNDFRHAIRTFSYIIITALSILSRLHTILFYKDTILNPLF